MTILENGYLLNQRYRICDILGQGGMGAVYRAIDENLDVTVAVKENSFYSEEYARQFQREAQILAALRHPNLPRVFDYFVIDQQGQYLVMDYIEGEDLRQWMSREESISEIEVIQIGIEICDALIYLHSRAPSITHRDIKPGNIKITSTGEVILVDFGLVKISGDKEITTTAARAMTPGYSPPEQYGDAPTDHRSDIFSLGATLYAALAGYLPEDSLSRATGKEQLTPLRHYNPEVSRKTSNAIHKALELHYENRWQSAQDFREALIDARNALPPSEWVNNRLSAAIQRDMEPGINSSQQPGRSKFFNRYLQKPATQGTRIDPVWIIFAGVFTTLLLMLGVSLLWPQGLQNFWAPSTITMAPETPLWTGESTATEAGTLEPGLALPSITAEPTNAQTATPSPTPIGGGRGKIAFVSERTGMPQIWLLDLVSRKTTQLTALNDGACQPDWSPDGEQIVFTSPCAGKRSRYLGSSLQIIDIQSGELTRLPTSLEGNFDPAWSPDGHWIAYTTLVNGKLQLMKVNLNNQSQVKLSEGPYDERDPAWSPDGSQLVFIRIRSVAQVWIMDQDGKNAIQFSRSGLIDNSNPVWYGEEELILFSQVLGAGSPSKQLYGMRLADLGEEEETRITPGSPSDYIPLMDNVDVSPDGYWLAFDYWYFDVLSDIYMMTFPGANLTQLTDHPAMDYDPVWCPAP